MRLTGKQKRYLRGLASVRSALFQIGKDGISDAVIDTINNGLRTHELVKITILKTVMDDVETVAFDLARYTDSELVQIIGRNVVLYKANPKNPRIVLP